MPDARIAPAPRVHRRTMLTPAPRSPSFLHALGLYLFDRAAARAGYTFETVATREARDEALRLRWQVYVDHGYIEPAVHPDGRFIDPYDDHSTLFLARHRGRPVGTARLIPAVEGTQVLDQYNLDLPRAVTLDQAAEVGRFAVAHDHRGGRRLVTLGLFRAAYGHSVGIGVRWWFGNTSAAFMRSMATFGDAISYPAEGPLEAHHLEARRILPGYFEQLGDEIELFLVDLARVGPSPARVAGLVRRRRA